MLPHLLCIDYETSGIDVRENKHQPISCGAIIVETKTLKAVDEIYLECQFIYDRFEWSNQAEGTHGLSRDHLRSQYTMNEAATKLFGFLVPYFKKRDAITLLGHNPAFDANCLNIWMSEINVKLRTSFRKLDTFSLGFGLFGAEDSDALFKLVGVKRSKHNSLEDAQATVAALQLSRKVGNIYEALVQESRANH